MCKSISDSDNNKVKVIENFLDVCKRYKHAVNNDLSKLA